MGTVSIDLSSDMYEALGRRFRIDRSQKRTASARLGRRSQTDREEDGVMARKDRAPMASRDAYRLGSLRQMPARRVGGQGEGRADGA